MYSHTHYDKAKIKLGLAIQHEQQRQRAEGLLQQDIELELTQEEMENMAQKEDARLRRAEWYERRMREKEEKEGKEEEEANDVLEDLVVQGGDVISAGSRRKTETSNPVKPKNPRGKKSRTEETIAEEVEEAEEEEKLEEVMRKERLGAALTYRRQQHFKSL